MKILKVKKNQTCRGNLTTEEGIATSPIRSFLIIKASQAIRNDVLPGGNLTTEEGIATSPIRSFLIIIASQAIRNDVLPGRDLTN